MSQKSLIKSFNTDFFLKYSEDARIKIQHGFENCVFINGCPIVGDALIDKSFTPYDYGRFVHGEDPEVAELYVEPSNESIVTIAEGSNATTVNTAMPGDFPPYNPVKIIQDTQNDTFYVTGKTNCDTMVTVHISSDTDTSVFTSNYKKLEKGKIIKICGEQSSVLATVIETEDIIISGLKYIGGKIKFATDSNKYSIVSAADKIIVNPREVDGDIEGYGERTIKILPQETEHSQLVSVGVNLTSDGNHDIFNEGDTLIGELTTSGTLYDYNFKTIYVGELYDSELYKESLEEVEPDTFVIKTSIREFSSYDSSISKSIIDGITDDFIHIHIDSSSDFWFKYSTFDASGNLYEDKYDFYSGWKYEQALDRPEPLVGNNASFALLRANPKLTGNIKVVVDSNENIFLDTFKVSKTLSNSSLRKVSLGKDEYYGRAVMRKYRNISAEEIFKVEDYCYDAFSYATSLKDQYYDKYNYGVRTNTDKMYSENFSFLAPIKVRKIVPDFFVIFKVKPNSNGKCYDERNYSSSNHIKYFIENGTVVKTYDMRKGSILGDYIRTFYENSKGYAGDCYVTYNHNRNNVFNGISVDSGVVISAQESNSLTKNVLSQAALNDWLTLGFERNRLVSKDILNLEFMFDDPEEDLFSTNVYFGLYIRVNGEKEDFSCIGISDDGIPVFNYRITGGSFLPEDNKDVIYGVETPDKFERLLCNIQSQDASEKIRKYMNKPYENIIHAKLIQTEDEIYRDFSYASIKFNDVLNPGEHYRIIDKDPNGQNTIYEVIVSNVKNKYFDISEINEFDSNGFKIYSLCIYGIPYRTEPHENDDLKRQIELLVTAFNSFNTDKIEASGNGTDTISIMYKRKFGQPEESSNISEIDDVVLIEKVCSAFSLGENKQLQLLYDFEDKSSYIFGADDLSKIFVYPETVYNKLNETLYPFGFENTGYRLCYVAIFTPLEHSDEYSTYLIDSDITDILNVYKSPLFKSEDSFEIYDGFNVSRILSNGTIERKKMLSIPGFYPGSSHILKFYGNQPITKTGYIDFYSNYPINAGVCSIFQIKDTYTDILDGDNSINFKEPVAPIYNNGYFYGEYNLPDYLGEIPYMSPKTSEDDVTDYFDKYKKYRLNENGDAVTFNNGFLKVISDSKKYKTDIPLICNYCCKFGSLGTDYSGNRIKIMYDISNNYRNIAKNTHVGFITVDENSKKDIAFPKYINSNAYNKLHPSFMDYILYGDGSISDLLYFEKSTSNKFSVSYSYGNDSLEFISGAIKMRIKSNNLSIVNISKYDGYSAILIGCAGNNPFGKFDYNIIIDETKNELALIYYNGITADEMIYNGGEPERTSIINCPSNSLLSENYFDLAKFVIPNDLVSEEDAYFDTSGFVVFLNGNRKTTEYTEDKLKWGIGSAPELTIYQNGNGFILTDDNGIYPILLNDGSILQNENESIRKYMNSEQIADLFSIRKTNKKSANTLTLEKIKTIFENGSPSILIKNGSGIKNFSNINGLVELKMMPIENGSRENYSGYPTIDGSVFSTESEVLFKDIFSFNYTEDELSTLFEKALNGCNIRINDVNFVEQIFMKKFSVDNYTGDCGIVEHKHLNPLYTCFDSSADIFKTFKTENEYSSSNAIKSGYEKNMFIGSRGTALKKFDGENVIDYITISSWKDYTVNKEKKYIELDLTTSIIEFILKEDGFKALWNGVSEADESSKTIYIKNTLLDYIHVDDSIVVEVRTKDSNTLSLNQTGKDFDDYKKLNNVKTYMSKSGQDYVLRIEDLKHGRYSIKVKINL